MLYSIALYIALLTFTINRISRLGSKSTAVVESGDVRPVDIQIDKVLVEA